MAHASLQSRPAISAETDQVDEAVDEAWDWIGPLLSSVGLSGVIGFACGAALKHFGRRSAITIGSSFILLQVPILVSTSRGFRYLQGLVYVGVVDIHWDVIEKKLDLTGDGKFDEDDLQVASRNVLRLLAQARDSCSDHAVTSVVHTGCSERGVVLHWVLCGCSMELIDGRHSCSTMSTSTTVISCLNDAAVGFLSRTRSIVFLCDVGIDKGVLRS